MNSTTTTEAKLKPMIFWEGLPVCGLLMKKVVEMYGDDIVIVGTKANVPNWNPEPLLSHKIVWLEKPNDIWEMREKFSDRNFIIHTGWAHSGWLRFDKFIKERNGAKIVSAIDNRFRRDLRQYIGAIWFRLYLKKHFDAVFVPGKSGIRLMRFLGMPAERIYTGVYGAFEEIFKDTNPIENRPDEFLFVGQLIKRKSIDVLVAGFSNYRKAGGSWKLRIVGNGPLASKCAGDGIILEPFAEPEKVAAKMNQAKVFILPSRDDNWGTVVCEAAACGMHLITTRTVGATYDLLQQKENGIVLRSVDAQDMQNAFFNYERKTTEKMIAGSQLSKKIAGNFSSQAYANAFTAMAKDLTTKNVIEKN
jgi:glycosyltransferase involved in cell wall biosynthesis